MITSVLCCVVFRETRSREVRFWLNPYRYSHHKAKAQVYVLKKEEGGRHTPFLTNYRPQFYFRTTDVTGVITLPEGTEMCMPGDNVEMTIDPDLPGCYGERTSFRYP